MGTLTRADHAIKMRLRKAGVLGDLDGNRLDLRQGVIMVTCADGDQLYDIFAHKALAVMQQRSDARIHTLALNGGALLLAEDSPLSRTNNEGTVLMEHIRGAMKLKGMRTVALYAHAPCGAATKMVHPPLRLDQVVALLIRAKTRVKSLGDGIKVACFLHVDNGTGKRTYHVSRDAWTSWAAENR